MKPILEYIISKSSKRYIIKVTDNNIDDIVFQEMKRLGYNADLNHIDTSEVTDFSYLFCANDKLEYYKLEYKKFNCDISAWNTSNVEKMCCTFNYAREFNCNINEWDVSKVNNFGGMFANCKEFNQPLDKWKFPNAESMNLMFYGCHKFNQDISMWDMSNVNNTQSMFEDCPVFNQDLSKWDIKKALKNGSTNRMFNHCGIEEKYKC
jgi:surface protein